MYNLIIKLKFFVTTAGELVWHMDAYIISAYLISYTSI